MAKDYFIDSEDEIMYLEMLENMDTLKANELYHKIKDDTVGTNLAPPARNKTFAQFTYKNLRYLILGCKFCGAEIRVKALATFMFKASLDEPMAPMVDNTHLKKLVFDNLHHKLPEIYKWSGLEYDESPKNIIQQQLLLTNSLTNNFLFQSLNKTRRVQPIKE